MPWPTRWLIGSLDTKLPEQLFLHVFDDGEAEAEMDFGADRTRALRFASADDADRFVRVHRLDGVGLYEHAAADLVAPVAPIFDRHAAVA